MDDEPSVSFIFDWSQHAITAQLGPLRGVIYPPCLPRLLWPCTISFSVQFLSFRNTWLCIIRKLWFLYHM